MIPTRLRQIIEDCGARCSGDVANLMVRGVCTDSRTVKAGDLFVAIKGERFDGHDYVDRARQSGAVACLVSEGVDDSAGPTLTVADPIEALGRMGAAHRRRLRAKVIAVTGSNGKTTTKGMIDRVLGSRWRGKAAVKSFNNRLGVPLTLLSAEEDDDYLVVEIGSSSPGEVKRLARMVGPDVAVITSIGWAHLEGLGDIEGVVREKATLLRQVAPGGLAVVNTDEPVMRAWLDDPRQGLAGDVRLVTFGFGDGVDLQIKEVETHATGTRFRVGAGPRLSISLLGGHNALNAVATLAVCGHLGMDEAAVGRSLATIEPAGMRLNVSQHGSYWVINDSYNANPSSMTAAIEVLGGSGSRPRILVAGDMLELGEQAVELHRHIGELAGLAGIEVIVGVGRQGGTVTAAARAVQPAVRTLVFDDAQAAAEGVSDWLELGAVVLVKGSRSMGMERVAQAVAEASSAPGKVGAAV